MLLKSKLAAKIIIWGLGMLYFPAVQVVCCIALPFVAYSEQVEQVMQQIPAGTIGASVFGAFILYPYQALFRQPYLKNDTNKIT